MKLEPSSADTLECVAVEIPGVMRKGFYHFVVTCCICQSLYICQLVRAQCLASHLTIDFRDESIHGHSVSACVCMWLCGMVVQ